MPFCSNCGTELPDEARDCPRCGQVQVAFQPASHQPYQAAYAPARRTEGQAVAALVLGIAGLVVCPVILSVVAIVLGNQAKTRIEADPTLEGEGMARAGVILGWIGVAFGIIGLAFGIFAFVFGAISSGF